MSMLKLIRDWRTSRRQQKLDAYARNLGHATPEEAEELRGPRKLFRNRMKAFVNGGLRDGTGISPTGTPIDFTADQKPPRH